MTPKSFWIIIVRLLGLWLLIELLTVVQNLVDVIYFFNTSGAEATSSHEIILQIIMYGINAVLILLLFYFLVFRTVFVVRILKLDSALQEVAFPVNLNYYSLIYISIFITAGLMIVNDIPVLCTSIVGNYRVKQVVTGADVNDIRNLVTSSVRIIIGLLLVFCNKAIAKYIDNETTTKEL